MKQEPDVLALFLHFLLLSSIAVGGTNTVLPDLHRYLVDTTHLITARQFADVYALAQAAPGPNVLYTTLLGQLAAGWLGAAATTLAVFLPSTVFTLILIQIPGVKPSVSLAFRRGMAPVAVGLTFSSGWLLLNSANHNVQGYTLSLLTTVVVLATRMQPLWLIAIGAVAGMAGLV